MKVLILCGGQGTRAYPYTQSLPKALLPVSGLPIVEQVMRIYASHGYDDFVLAGGHLIEAIASHFRGSAWKVECVDTGRDTDTGDRIRCCLDRLGERFHATYCDGLGDIDLAGLVRFHTRHGDGGTMTACRLRSQYGVLQSDEGDRVTAFVEKPVLPEYWINAGFFVFETGEFARVPGSNLEREVLPAMAARSTLRVFRHRGFWRSMDTYKDQQELDPLWGPFSTRLQSVLDSGAGEPAGEAAGRSGGRT